MKQWWSQLPEKERYLVILMAVLISFFLLFHLVWSPINNGLVKEAKKLERNQELLTYVKQSTASIKKGGAVSTKGKVSGSLSSVISRVAKRHQISISRVQPQGDDIQVWIEEVSFNQLLIWLDDLKQSAELEVKTIDITEGNQGGIVKIRRLQLGRM